MLSIKRAATCIVQNVENIAFSFSLFLLWRLWQNGMLEKSKCNALKENLAQFLVCLVCGVMLDNVLGHAAPRR